MTFLTQARQLFRLVLVQKTVELILRAFWLGGAAYLLCWGVDSLSGGQQHPEMWAIGAGSVWGVVLISIFFKPLSLKDFIWRVDDKFKTRQQLSTALEVSLERDSELNPQESVEGLLLNDAAGLLQDIFRRVQRRGWRLRNELESLLIVGLLLAVVNLAGMESLSMVSAGSSLGLLPAEGGDPGYLDVFSSGIPGGTGNQFAAGPNLRTAGEGAAGFAGLTLDEASLDQVREVFNEVGSQLKDGAATAEFGQALAGGTFSEAADRLGEISGNIDRLSQPTTQLLANAFSFGARQLFYPRYSVISDLLDSTSEALTVGSQDAIQDQLRQLSEVLKWLAALESGAVQAQKELQPPEINPFSRVGGEGENLMQENPGDISSALVVPGGGAESRDVLEGALDLYGSDSENPSQCIPVILRFHWTDYDVVSRYFSPQ